MGEQGKKTVEMIKKHLGANTPQWIVDKIINILCEFTIDNDEENVELKRIIFEMTHHKGAMQETEDLWIPVVAEYLNR